MTIEALAGLSLEVLSSGATSVEHGGPMFSIPLA